MYALCRERLASLKYALALACASAATIANLMLFHGGRIDPMHTCHAKTTPARPNRMPQTIHIYKLCDKARRCQDQSRYLGDRPRLRSNDEAYTLAVQCPGRACCCCLALNTESHSNFSLAHIFSWHLPLYRLQATPLWFLAQLSFNASLLYTSVTSNTVLSSASSLFTFVLSVLLLGERYTFPKLACVAACMAGEVMLGCRLHHAGHADPCCSYIKQNPFTEGFSALWPAP